MQGRPRPAPEGRSSFYVKTCFALDAFFGLAMQAGVSGKTPWLRAHAGSIGFVFCRRTAFDGQQNVGKKFLDLVVSTSGS